MHDFALTFNPENPEVTGITGILEAYKRSIQSVQLWGPTNFSPIIQRVNNYVRNNQHANLDFGKRSYTVLMILTDGVITDLQQTINSMAGL